jgi:predicted ester cyclase
MTLSTQPQAEVAVRSMQVMATGTQDDLRRYVHPDAVNRESSAEPPATRGRGPDAFWATALWLRSAFSELAFAVDTVLVDGDLVATHGTMSGRQTGDMVIWTPDGRVERAFAPTGRRFEVRHAHFMRFSEGLVVEHWAVRDDQGLALQLGWVPPSPAYLVRCALATRRARQLR